jgi:mono/diheme cytochrome c family protein
MHLQLDGAAIFSEVCSGCHGLDRPISASISRTDEVWALIHEMEQNGVVVSDAEAAAIVEYVCKLKRCVTG